MGDEEKMEAKMSMSHKRLASSITISDNPTEVFCVKFSPDGRMLAAGGGDGTVRVFNTYTGRLSYTLNAGGTSNLPTTSLRFRPINSASKTKNVLLATNSSGSVQHWHITSGKCLHNITDNVNQLYACDYRSDGAMFATAGKDYHVRIYDEATKAEVVTLTGGYRSSGTKDPGHSNRIFSLKFHPTDPDIIMSGGWDNTVQIWDMRTERSVRSIFGPHICGDSLDCDGDTILTGSWRPDDILETWDYGSGRKIESIPWHQSSIHGQPCMIYAASYSPNYDMFAAGGSGANEAKVFDRTAGNALVGTIAGLSRGIFTLDFSPTTNKIAVAGGDATIRIIDIIGAHEDNAESVINFEPVPTEDGVDLEWDAKYSEHGGDDETPMAKRGFKGDD